MQSLHTPVTPVPSYSIPSIYGHTGYGYTHHHIPGYNSSVVSHYPSPSLVSLHGIPTPILTQTAHHQPSQQMSTYNNMPQLQPPSPHMNRNDMKNESNMSVKNEFNNNNNSSENTMVKRQGFKLEDMLKADF